MWNILMMTQSLNTKHWQIMCNFLAVTAHGNNVKILHNFQAPAGKDPLNSLIP